jgi:D-alanyl-lipoteichoic acid acyltransferase DltB (MBOAT superfamily)
MNVPSAAFLGFTALVAVLLYASHSRWWRDAVVLVANVAFLATFSRDPRAWLPFAGFLAIGYLGVCALQSDSRAARRLFPTICFAIVFTYIWLKQYAFIPATTFLRFPYMVLGLSYVFFRVLHLAIDARDRTLPDRIGLLSYLSYTLNFSAIVSGPIQRYQDYHRMHADPPVMGMRSVGRAIERIIVGFFKVAVLSLLLHAIQGHALHELIPDVRQASPLALPLASRASWGVVVAVVYPLYLYCNFSGYTDFAIGTARFIGNILPENFDRPFFAENFLDFWSRWHITLSSWLKTYVYSPLLLSLSRRLPSRSAEPYLGVLAFFVTFFLVGLWHGRTWLFVWFGILQGLGVAGNKLYQIGMARRLGRAGYRALCANAAYRAGARGLTFTWFTFTLFWFWSSWTQIGAFIDPLGGVGLALVWGTIFLGSTMVLAGIEAVRTGVARSGVALGSQPLLASRYARTVWCTVLAVVSASTTLLLNLPAPQIVYRAF